MGYLDGAHRDLGDALNDEVNRRRGVALSEDGGACGGDLADTTPLWSACDMATAGWLRTTPIGSQRPDGVTTGCRTIGRRAVHISTVASSSSALKSGTCLITSRYSALTTCIRSI